MSHVLEVRNASGRTIHLSRERWKHVTTRHPELVERLDDVERCLRRPTLIARQHGAGNRFNYFLYDRSRRRYLLVAVRYLNGRGYVITAFTTQKVIRR